MKIKILELDKHRNETTFRPYINAINSFKEYGIEFVDKNPDIYWVGHASIVNKKVSLQESIDIGCNFIKKLDAPYILFDGQDSSSLMGTWDVFRSLPGLKIAKNVVLKDYSVYTKKFPNGRWFWGEDSNGYSVSLEDIKLMQDKLVHSGTNWLNTFGNKLSFLKQNSNKQYDVAVMVGLCGDNYEHTIKVDEYYNNPRKKLFEEVNKLNVKVITTEKTGKIDKQKYMQTLYDSKICISPFGYGEVNIREIECLVTGTAVIKPNIDIVKSTPYIYGDGFTYNCNSDYSNIKDVVENILSDYNHALKNVDKQRFIFNKASSDTNIVSHVIKTLLN
jgi:hypothetical protein